MRRATAEGAPLTSIESAVGGRRPVRAVAWLSWCIVLCWIAASPFMTANPREKTT